MRVADELRRLDVQGTVLPVGGKGTAQHWAAGIALVVSGGFGMADVHGRPAAKDVTAAANCDHAHVRVVTASDVHFSRELLGDVLEQAILAVRQDVIDRLSPPDGDCSRCRLRALTVKPKVKRVYPSTHAVHESDEKSKRRRSATLVAVDKGVVSCPQNHPKVTSVILSTSNKLLVSGAATEPVPDMATTTMEADSTARDHKKQRRGDMRGAQHADVTQQQSTMINRRVSDKTHTRQPAPALCGVHTGANGAACAIPPLASSRRPYAPVRTPRST